MSWIARGIQKTVANTRWMLCDVLVGYKNTNGGLWLIKYE